MKAKILDILAVASLALVVAAFLLAKSEYKDFANWAVYALVVVGIVFTLLKLKVEGEKIKTSRREDFLERWKREAILSVIAVVAIVLLNRFLFVTIQVPFWIALINWPWMLGVYAFWRPNKQDLFRIIYLQWVLAEEGSKREQKLEKRLLSEEFYFDGQLTVSKWACAFGHVLDQNDPDDKLIKREKKKFDRLPIPEDVKEKVRAEHQDFWRWKQFKFHG